jgi:hypothetical protein
MTLLSEYLTEHPVKVRRLRIATGGRCENCGNTFPPVVLEVHLIGSPPDIEDAGRDLQKHLLVLCPACRRSFCSRPVEESLQRELVRYRSAGVGNLMREILEHRPRKYVPPGDFDPAAVFQEMFDSGALDLCLNGG